MSTTIRAAWVLGLSLMVGSAFAATDGQALAKKNNCMTCHNLKGKKVGPGFNEIAKKYRGDAAAQAKLEQKVRKGGSGSFGKAMMPPQKGVSDKELKNIIGWILNQ